MRNLTVAFGLCGLLVMACDPTVSIEPSTGGSSSSSSSTSSGGNADPGAPYSLVFSDRLATYPLAAAPDGSVWLFGGKYIEDASGISGTWDYAWVKKIDVHGQVVFEGQIDGSNAEVEPIAIKTDAYGNVLLVGHARRPAGNTVSLNTWDGTLEIPAEAPFFMKLDPNGNTYMAFATDAQQTIGDPPAYRYADVGADEHGNVFVAARVGPPFVSDQTDSIVASWSPQITDLKENKLAAMDTVFRKLEVELNGDYWLARSSFYSKWQVQRFTKWGELKAETTGVACWVDVLAFAPDGQFGFFMARAEDPAEHCYSSLEHHNPDGTVDWFVETTEAYIKNPTLTRAGNGHVWLALGLQGTIDINGSTLSGTDADDIVVTDLDADGHFAQTTTYSGSGNDYVVQMALDGAGRRYMAGYFANQIDFGSGSITNTSGQPQAIFVTRLDP